MPCKEDRSHNAPSTITLYWDPWSKWGPSAQFRNWGNFIPGAGGFWHRIPTHYVISTSHLKLALQPRCFTRHAKVPARIQKMKKYLSVGRKFVPLLQCLNVILLSYYRLVLLHQRALDTSTILVSDQLRMQHSPCRGSRRFPAYLSELGVKPDFRFVGNYFRHRTKSQRYSFYN